MYGRIVDKDPDYSSRTIARYSAAQFWLALVVAVVGFGAGGFVGGRETAPTDTTTRTITETVTIAGPGGDDTENGGVGPARSCVADPRYGDREPNNLPGQAGGPIVSGDPLVGAIRTTNDVDYFGLCAVDDVELELAMECIEAPQGDCGAYASLGLHDASSESFEPGSPVACTITQAGRYFIRVESNNYPVRYRLTVDAAPASALVTELEGSLDTGEEPCS